MERGELKLKIKILTLFIVLLIVLVSCQSSIPEVTIEISKTPTKTLQAKPATLIPEPTTEVEQCIGTYDEFVCQMQVYGPWERKEITHPVPGYPWKLIAELPEEYTHTVSGNYNSSITRIKNVNGNPEIWIQYTRDHLSTLSP
jgi:hypothetical protein